MSRPHKFIHTSPDSPLIYCQACGLIIRDVRLTTQDIDINRKKASQSCPNHAKNAPILPPTP